MSTSIITTLAYETYIQIGASFHLETDWFTTDQEIKAIIIDQDHVHSKILSLYPNGFVMFLEQNQDGSLYRTNYPLYLPENSSTYRVKWD